MYDEDPTTTTVPPSPSNSSSQSGIGSSSRRTGSPFNNENTFRLINHAMRKQQQGTHKQSQSQFSPSQSQVHSQPRSRLNGSYDDISSHYGKMDPSILAREYEVRKQQLELERQQSPQVSVSNKPAPSCHNDDSATYYSFDFCGPLGSNPQAIEIESQSNTLMKNTPPQNDRLAEYERRKKDIQHFHRLINEQMKRVVQLEVELESHDLHLTSYAKDQNRIVRDAMQEIRSEPDMEQKKKTKQLIHKLIKDYRDMENRYKAEKLKNARNLIEMEQDRWRLRKEIEYMESGLDIDQFLPHPNSQQARRRSKLFNDDKKQESYDGEEKFNEIFEEELPRGGGDKEEHKHLGYEEHLGASRQYWRDIILGVNDGLVSTFLLVATVAGGGLSTTDCLLTAVAGSIAGAVSMCAGEYVATKAQNEVMDGEIALETQHIREHKENELNQVNELLQLIGISDRQRGIQNALKNHYNKNPDALLKLMIALELGIVEEEKRSPVMAGLTSCALFIVGSLPSVVPFAFTDADPVICLIGAAAATCAALCLVGAIKTWATRGNLLVSAAENLVIAGLGGGFAYVVGMGFDQLLHSGTATTAAALAAAGCNSTVAV